MHDLTPPFPLTTPKDRDAAGPSIDVVPTPADSFRILVWHRGTQGGRAFLASESFMSGHPVWSSGGSILGLRDLDAVRNAIADVRREVQLRGSSRFGVHGNEVRIAFPGQTWTSADRLSDAALAKLERMLEIWEARVRRL